MICEQCKIQTIFWRERERMGEREIGRDPEYKLFFLFYLIKKICTTNPHENNYNCGGGEHMKVA